MCTFAAQDYASAYASSSHGEVLRPGNLLQGREGGRGRGDYGGRGEYGGRGRGGPAHPDSRGPPPGPTNILTHRDADSSGFQEAGPAKSKGRFRGWETHTPATAPRTDHQVYSSAWLYSSSVFSRFWHISGTPSSCETSEWVYAFCDLAFSNKAGFRKIL